jgi:hypothetical protein
MRDRTPMGVPDDKGFEILAPLRGATFFSTCSGGFRFASTAGYHLPALEAEPMSDHGTVCTCTSLQNSN